MGRMKWVVVGKCNVFDCACTLDLSLGLTSPHEVFQTSLHINVCRIRFSGSIIRVHQQQTQAGDLGDDD